MVSFCFRSAATASTENGSVLKADRYWWATALARSLGLIDATTSPYPAGVDLEEGGDTISRGSGGTGPDRFWSPAGGCFHLRPCDSDWEWDSSKRARAALHGRGILY